MSDIREKFRQCEISSLQTRLEAAEEESLDYKDIASEAIDELEDLREEFEKVFELYRQTELFLDDIKGEVKYTCSKDLDLRLMRKFNEREEGKNFTEQGVDRNDEN